MAKSGVKNKASQAYEKLSQLIMSGRFDPDERLTEAKAARLLGMTRGPVRESILRLQAEGLLKHKGPGRSRVVKVEDEEPMTLVKRYQLREALEPLVAQLAASNLNGWQVRTLRELAEQYKQSIENDENRFAAFAALMQFLVTNCGNEMVADAWERYQLSPPGWRSRQLENRVSGDDLAPDEYGVGYIESLVEAIASHDAHRAGEVVRKQYAKLMPRLQKYFLDSSSGLVSDGNGLHAPKQ